MSQNASPRNEEDIIDDFSICQMDARIKWVNLNWQNHPLLNIAMLKAEWYLAWSTFNDNNFEHLNYRQLKILNDLLDEYCIPRDIHE